jgi:hypothetical protein
LRSASRRSGRGETAVLFGAVLTGLPPHEQLIS